MNGFGLTNAGHHVSKKNESHLLPMSVLAKTNQFMIKSWASGFSKLKIMSLKINETMTQIENHMD
jgi:hypothetical protein